MKPQDIKVTIKEIDGDTVAAGELRWNEDEYFFYPDANLIGLSAGDLSGIARLAMAAEDLVRKP